MRLIVGLTGGIGSGKSAASVWFAEQGITVVDADIVARQVVAPEQPLLALIQQHFGSWVLQDNGELDRQALRAHIFQSPAARQELENITHPAIRQSIQHQLHAATSAYAILVSPLLFETNQYLLTQRTLLIDASEDIQIARATARDQQTPEQIKKIIAAQMPRAEKRRRADDIIINDGQLTHLYQQLAILHKTYLAIS